MATSGRSAKRPRPKRDGRTKRARLTIIVEDRLWRNEPQAIALVRRAGREALELAARRQAPRTLTILLSSDARLKELNALFRGKRKPTNVLSFPASERKYLGDIAIAYGVASREAKNEGKRLAAHVAHLAAHGVLHLLGYDHGNEPEAAIMEALETRVLARLGFPDPYARIRAAA